MAQLRILPGNLANMIAAGEVVQRPASVVKELMENALDAGATRVQVLIVDAGRTLIRVIDNGSGMSPDDAVLCFERHATSKIATPEDLERILTFGFRGEALASIAAVSEVTLRTRRKEDELGVEVSFAASEHLATREAAVPEGADFSVRNLFYNVPARRKFLKTDNVELRHIIEEFTRVALTRPDVGFELRHGDRDIFSLKPVQSLKFRILALLGSTVVGDVVDVMADTSLLRLSGYAGRPESARKTLGNQFLFVNGRFFKSPYLTKAVQKAYEGLIPEGSYPSFFLYIETDPERVDVNISPTKSEVKFADEPLVFQTLYAAVKEAVGRYSIVENIDFDAPASEALPHIGRHFEEYRPVAAPQAPVDSSYNPFEGESFSAPAAFAPAAHTYDRPKQDYSRLFEERPLAHPAREAMLAGGKYIVAPASGGGLLVVQIRRAQERILYEQFLAAFQKEEPVTQAVLFPVQVQVGPSERLLFEAHAALLRSLGFEIDPFGSDSIVVNGVPQGFSAAESDIRAMVSDLILALSDAPEVLSQTVRSALAEKFALLGAAHGKLPDTPMAARLLLDSLLQTENPERTSSGKRVMVILSPDELDKKF